MKRVLAIIMAMAMVLSMGITAFAAGETEPTPPANGTITITNATIDQTYTVYKVFDATMEEADEKNEKAVSYTLNPEAETVFEAIFTVDENGNVTNQYFNYNSVTHTITKKTTANDTDVVEYLAELAKSGVFPSVGEPVIADSHLVSFTGLDFGYYIIIRDGASAVTINSNTPHVEVIDKNQKPGSGFDKVIVGSEKPHQNVAPIGGKVDYKISFEATNYDGDKHIRYYQILDTLGSSLIADVSSFKVFVGGEELTMGWILNNSTDTATTVPEGKIGGWIGDINEAEWYLVYLGDNKFRVTLPWQSNHIIEGNTGAYTITYPEKDTEDNVIEHKSKYESPINITLTYSAYVNADAPVGGGTHDALTNTANASWSSKYETGTTPTVSVLTETFGIGVLKDDGATGKNLPGAKFRLWKDQACTKRVYVVPTKIEGVYVLDIKDTPAAKENGADDLMLSGNFYADYLGEAYANGVQDYLMVTPINGKIIILGLEAGTYYLQEVEAPDGYNALTAPVALEAGKGQTPFYVFADTNGKVADLRDPDATHARNTYNVTHTTVHNSKGVELPSTGGEGTVMLITLGSIIAMAFAVLLVTQKKMSIYKD